MKKIYTALIALFAATTFAGGCGLEDKKEERNEQDYIFSPENVRSQTDLYMNCGMVYDWEQESKHFLLECYPTKKVPNRHEIHVLPECDFPNADVNYDCKTCSPTEIVRYKGQDALRRAKIDFDNCRIKGLILDGGWWEAFVYSGTFPVTDAVSPLTLDRLTESELKDIAFGFGNQMVGALKEPTGYRGGIHRDESYFQR